MRDRFRGRRDLIRRAWAFGPGGFDLSEWEVESGSGTIGSSPGSDYLIAVDDDSASHSPFPLANCAEFANESGVTFRVRKPFVTLPSTGYTITTRISFLAAGDRVTFRYYDANFGVYAEGGSGDTPFTTAQTLVHTITTDAGSDGEITYIGINGHSAAGNPSTFFFEEPVLSLT